jgi:hypothetical protein
MPCLSERPAVVADRPGIGPLYIECDRSTVHTMAEHELKFAASDADDKAVRAKVQQLREDPNVYDIYELVRGDGHVVTYETRD